MQLQKPAIIQEQRQKLSPQMIQSIRLMAMPLQDLKEEIQQELEANPALEVLEDKSTVSLETLPEGEGDFSDTYENASDPGFVSRSNADDDSKRMFIEGAITKAETLQEHLLWQLRLQPIPDDGRSCGETLIQNLSDDGFHKEDPFVVCRDFAPGVVEASMALIHSFEPVGTCVRDYRESLLVQAGLSPDAPPAASTILRDCIDLLEHGKHAEIQKRLKLTDREMAKALAFIKTLNPFPGRLYSSSDPSYVLPDILVKIKDGDIVIVLNDEEIPVLGLNPFIDRLSSEKHDKGTDAFVRDTIRQAMWFIKSIHQRNQTLLKVARAVVEFQRAFFSKGPKYLAPLTLHDVAEEVGVHETTVSRIANRKYMQTDWGIFEIRYFFTNSISGAGSRGSRFSKEGVKQVIKEIIEGETRALSDQDIAESLEKRGIKIARRTVAKYRHELDLDSSFGRRR